MRRPRVLTPLLFLAVAAVDVVAVTIYFSAVYEILDRVPHWPKTAAVLFMALICSQLSLVAVWSGLARRPAPWPIAVDALVVLGWSIFLSSRGSMVRVFGFNTAGWATVLATQALALAGPLCTVRLLRMRLVRPAAANQTEQDPSDRPTQFSIAYLLSWALAVAVVLGLYRWASQVGDMGWLHELVTMGRDRWHQAALFVAANIAIAWSAVWAALGQSKWWLRMAAPPTALAAVLGGYTRLFVEPEFWWAFIVFCVTQTALLLAGLAVLRIDGYRLGKQSGKRKAESGSPPEP